MSDAIWGALIGAGAIWVGIWLKHMSKTRAANKTAARTERQQASSREQSEARRRDETERDNQRVERERLAAQLHTLREQVLRSRQGMRGWLDYGQGRRRWSPIDQPMPSVASDSARGVAALEVAALHPLAAAYHEATVALELALRERMPRGHVDGLVSDWERAYQRLEQEVVKLREGVSSAGSGVAPPAAPPQARVMRTG